MVASTNSKNNIPSSESQKAELTLLDLYSGCGGMSTGLCLGAKVSSVNLVTVLYMKFFSLMYFFLSLQIYAISYFCLLQLEMGS